VTTSTQCRDTVYRELTAILVFFAIDRNAKLS
jgi:hypothetical protein